MGRITEIPLVIRGIRASNLALSNTLANWPQTVGYGRNHKNNLANLLKR